MKRRSSPSAPPEETSPTGPNELPGGRPLGLLKYDCPNPSCGAWFVTLDPLSVRCVDCDELMIDTQVI